MINLEPGDGFSTKAKGVVAWCSRNLMQPENTEFHYGMICRKRHDGDYNILESISKKGLCPGVLSIYKEQDLTFWRVNCPEELRHQAPDALRKWGRSHYDYLLPMKLFFGAIVSWLVILWREHKFRKLHAEELKYFYRWDDVLACTEAFYIGHATEGVNIVPWGVPPIPSSFRQAELEGRIYQLKKVS